MQFTHLYTILYMNKEELKRTLISDGLFRKDGGLNAAWLHNRSKNYNLEYLEGESLQEKIYLLFHERKYCVICGKPTPFKSWSRGYLDTCSKECKKVFDGETLRKNKEILKSDKVKNKRKQTCLNRYGCDNVFKNKEIKEKIKNTLIDRYGVEHPAQNEDILYKIKETNLNNHDGMWSTQTEKNKEAVKNTCLRKYGQEYYFHSKDYEEKTASTYMKKYGYKHNFMDPKIQSQIKTTNKKRYGCEYPMQNPSVREKAFAKVERTKPEAQLYEFLKNRGFTFEEKKTINNKNYDFVIYKNGKINILVEIDGRYFHGILSDPNDKHVTGFTDCERFLNTPENVKLIVCDENNVKECMNLILKEWNMSYENYIKEILNNLPKDFPYPNYSKDRLLKDYKNLCDQYNFKLKARIADSTIRYFHKSIYKAHKGNLPSPLEAWNNKDLLEKCVRNRFIYSSSLSSKAIADGFNVCKIAPKVSVFSASLSKNLIEEYLGEFNSIFDPFSGFSGRMLGTCASNKTYLGQDINEDHVRESNEIIDFHRLKARVIKKDILEDQGEYECLFTCPPYSDKEIWNENEDIKSCDEWIDECLKRYKCKKYLFVVDSTEKYKKNIVKILKNKSHFGSNNEYVILL